MRSLLKALGQSLPQWFLGVTQADGPPTLTLCSFMGAQWELTKKPLGLGVGLKGPQLLPPQFFNSGMSGMPRSQVVWVRPV